MSEVRILYLQGESYSDYFDSYFDCQTQKPPPYPVLVWKRPSSIPVFVLFG